jgi:hypothetical protein
MSCHQIDEEDALSKARQRGFRRQPTRRHWPFAPPKGAELHRAGLWPSGVVAAGFVATGGGLWPLEQDFGHRRRGFGHRRLCGGSTILSISFGHHAGGPVTSGNRSCGSSRFRCPGSGNGASGPALGSITLPWSPPAGGIDGLVLAFDREAPDRAVICNGPGSHQRCLFGVHIVLRRAAVLSTAADNKRRSDGGKGAEQYSALPEQRAGQPAALPLAPSVSRRRAAPSVVPAASTPITAALPGSTCRPYR